MGEHRPNLVTSDIVASGNEAAHDLVAWMWSVLRHSLAVFGGAVMTTLLFASEHQRGEAYSWRSAEWILGATLLLAFFLSWRESHRSLSRTRRDLARANAPPPRFNFNTAIVSVRLLGKSGWRLSPEMAIFGAIHLRIKNLGADSLTEDWRVTARSVSGAEILVSVIGLGTDGFDIDFENGLVITYHEEDCIYMRAREAIRSGSGVDGVLIVYFADISTSDDIDAGTITVAFNDVAGAVWSTPPWKPEPPEPVPLYYNPGLPNVKQKPKVEELMMAKDEQVDPETAMERFRDLLGHLVSVSKEDVGKIERAAQELVENALGPPPAQGPALTDDKD